MLKPSDINGSKSYWEVESKLTSDPDFRNLNFFKRLYKEFDYHWNSRYGGATSKVLYNQCWSSGEFEHDLYAAVSGFVEFLPKKYKTQVEFFAKALIALMHSHWHSFLLVQMRESMAELYVLLLYKENKIDRDKAIDILSDVGLKQDYINELLDIGVDIYKRDYDERDSSKRKCELASRKAFQEYRNSLR